MRDLGRQPPPAFGLRRRKAAEVQLVDDGQHEDLEGHHVHLRAAGHDLELVAHGAHGDEVALEAEDAQEVDEVALDEAQRAQVVQLVGLEAQGAQVVELALDLVLQLGQRVGRRAAVVEAVLGLRLRKAMQHGLPHRELVQVGVEQAGDDGHRAGLRVNAARRRRRRRSRHAGRGACMSVEEGLGLRLEAGHRAHAIAQQPHARQLTAQVLHQVLHRGAHAVAAGFARHQQRLRAAPVRDQLRG
jgi:hypothetical protein